MKTSNSLTCFLIILLTLTQFLQAQNIVTSVNEDNPNLPTELSFVGNLPLPAGIDGTFGAATDGRYLYVPLDNNQLRVYDMLDPSSPQLVSTISGPSFMLSSCYYNNNMLYITDIAGKLFVYDCSDPANLVLKKSKQVDGEILAASFSGNYAYTLIPFPSGSSGKSLFVIFDISDPVNPIKKSSVDIDEVLGSGKFLYLLVNRNLVYIKSASFSGSSITIIDVSNPLSPKILSTTNLAMEFDDQILGYDDYFIVSQYKSGKTKLHVYSTIDPTEPQLINSYELPGSKEIKAMTDVEGTILVYCWSSSSKTISTFYYNKETNEFIAGPEIADTEGYGTGEFVILKEPFTRLGKLNKSSNSVQESSSYNYLYYYAVYSYSKKTSRVVKITKKTPGSSEPTLTVSGDWPSIIMCPSEIAIGKFYETGRITLYADEIDDWTLSELSLTASGSGDDRLDIDKVKIRDVYAQYDRDNGTAKFIFKPAINIPADETVELTVEYSFAFVPDEYGYDTVKTFAWKTKDINAEPDNYETGIIEGSARLNPWKFARVQVLRGEQLVGCFAKINDAANASSTQDGDLVLVCDGEYEEKVLIQKSIDLLSMHGSDKTTIKNTEGVSIIAIDINGAANGSSTQDGDLALVRDGEYEEEVLIQKSIDLSSVNGGDKTTIKSKKDADIITLNKDDKDVYIGGFTLSGDPSKTLGITVLEAEKISIENNVFRNLECGIRSCEKMINQINIHDNVFREMQYESILINPKNEGVSDIIAVEKNTFYPSWRGITIDLGGNSVVETLKINSNKGTIHPTTTSDFNIEVMNGRCEELQFKSNEILRLTIRYLIGNAIIKDNINTELIAEGVGELSIYDNKLRFCFLTNIYNLRCEGNELQRGMYLEGIRLSTEGFINENTFYDRLSLRDVISSEDRFVIRKNDFIECDIAGILLHNSGGISIIDNKFNNIDKVSIIIFDGDGHVIRNNDFTECGEAISLEDSKGVSIIDNKFNNIQRRCIIISESKGFIVEKNKFNNIESRGIEISGSNNFNVAKNNFNNVESFCIDISGGSNNFIVEKNEFCENKTAFFIVHSEKFSIKENIISKCVQTPSILASSNGEIKSNKFEKNHSVSKIKSSGLSIALCSYLNISNNEFYNNEDFGLSLYKSNNINVIANRCFGNKSGFVSEDCLHLVFRLNWVADNFSENTGINVENSEVEIIGNRITNNNGNGIYIGENAYASISQNTISGNNPAGLNNANPNVTINASNNYWGNSDGPQSGDIIGNVDVSSWLSAPVKLLVSFSNKTKNLAETKSDSVLVSVQNLDDLDDLVSITLKDEKGLIHNEEIEFSKQLEDSAGYSFYVYYSAPAGNNENNKIIVEVNSLKDTTLTASDTMTVFAYQPLLKNLVITPDSISIYNKTDYLFRASCYDQNDNDYDAELTWSATLGEIDSTGLLRADSTLVGESIITATNVESGISSSVTVYLSNNEPVVSSIQITPETPEVEVNKTIYFNAQAFDQNEYKINCNIIWDATGGTITSYGLFTAGEVPGNYYVSAADTAANVSSRTNITIVSVTGVEEETTIPFNYRLYQNYPNPFNPSTTINYALPYSSHVTLKIYDILGREVAELVNTVQQAGVYKVEFNAGRFASGVYFYRISAGEFSDVKKLILLK